MAVVDHDNGVMALGKVADFGQLGQVAVHREHAVGRDQPQPAPCCLFQFLFELGHVGVPIAHALRLTESDAVNDAGMIQLVAQHGVLVGEQRLEEPAVRVEA